MKNIQKSNSRWILDFARDNAQITKTLAILKYLILSSFTIFPMMNAFVDLESRYRKIFRRLEDSTSRNAWRCSIIHSIRSLYIISTWNDFKRWMSSVVCWISSFDSIKSVIWWTTLRWYRWFEVDDIGNILSVLAEQTLHFQHLFSSLSTISVS